MRAGAHSSAATIGSEILYYSLTTLLAAWNRSMGFPKGVSIPFAIF
ncbi:MAG: hypothetical protein HW419_264 [Deltaproteobacteria bacterium]|nr:hypothetical protein [Deltaproteobacteria bacterium]